MEPISHLLQSGFRPSPEEWSIIHALPLNLGKRKDDAKRKLLDRADALYRELQAVNQALPRDERSTAEELFQTVADDLGLNIRTVRNRVRGRH
jgi:hypothetical protein